MLKNLKKMLIMSVCIMVMSVVSVSAGYVTCRQEAATGYGIYQANCYGNVLRCHGYYDSQSEKYTVMNYLEDNEKGQRYSAGCYAGKRNADISIDVKQPYNSYAHKHSFTVNMD